MGLGLVVKEQKEVTLEELKKLFPKKKNTITEETVKVINDSVNDPEFQGYKLTDTLAQYQNVMLKNSLSIEQYIDAVKFCAYLESEGDSYVEAYKKTFIRRKFVQDRLEVDTASIEYRELTNAASRYRKSPAVVDILTMADVPLYLMFQGFRYEATSILMDRARNSRHDKDKISAAKAILENIKPPENMKIELDVGMKENSAIQDLNNQLAEAASNALIHLEAGSTSLGELGAMKPKGEFIEGEIDE